PLSPSSPSTLRHPPTSPLFPYTTLFRSPKPSRSRRTGTDHADARFLGAQMFRENGDRRVQAHVLAAARNGTNRHCSRPEHSRLRSEEHTSELQSPYDLVCRLLLEKKKK